MEQHRRKPWLAALLCFFDPLIGFAYAGSIGKGLFFLLLAILAYPALFILLEIEITLASLSAILWLVLLISAAIIISCYSTAKKQPDEYELKLYNKWWVYISLYAFSSFVIAPISQNYSRNHIIQAYNIPAGSMLPTLNIGDHLLVNKRIYKKKNIERGDIIVFPLPNKPTTDYIKRVVGLPGETVEIIDKEVFINGLKLPKEHTLNLDSHILLREHSERDNYGPITIPENSLFVMGDNRDNSHDSRFWGFVPVNTVKGKAFSIYWSWNKDKSEVRWKRIGQKIQ
jgi:signal peptidase I